MTVNENNVNSDELSSIDSFVQSKVVKHTKLSFTSEVENLVWMDDITYLESIQTLSEKYNIEAEDIPKLITEDLFYKIKDEAENLSLLKEKNKKKKLF